MNYRLRRKIEENGTRKMKTAPVQEKEVAAQKKTLDTLLKTAYP
jgi:hypothetical protein